MKKFAPKAARSGLLKLLGNRSAAWFAGCLAAPCLLLAAPAFSASFDCSKSGSSNEKIICNDPQLSAMDDKLGKTFKLARKKATDRRAFNTASDKQWRWREQHCTNRECLVDWYRQRQNELEATLNGTPMASASDQVPAATAAALTAPAPAVKPAKAAKPAVTDAPAAATPAVTAPVARVVKPSLAPASASAPAPTSAPVVASAAAAYAAYTASAASKATAPVPAKAPKLQLQLSSTQIANIAPEGVTARAHYLSASKGEYMYADPDAKGDAQATVSVHYLGTDHGQHIIETRRKDVYTRYTCSADCSLIGKLELPGDAETDMVFLKNDHKSLPSQIVTDALNGLLLESVVVRPN